MSRSNTAHRGRDDGHAGSAGSFGVAVAGVGEDWDEQRDRLVAVNARLKDELSEVEAWYRILQVDHATFEGRMAESGRRLPRIPGRDESTGGGEPGASRPGLPVRPRRSRPGR